jgi:AhpD family alkylhydroperoxidase
MPSNASETQVAGRIPMLEREQVSPEMQAVYDALLKQRGLVPNMFKTLAHTPSLALGIAGLLKALLSDGALPGWYKELIATRLSVLQNSRYAVSAHALSAEQKGATVAQIAAARADFESGPFSEKEKLGFRCAERLHLGADAVDDAFFGDVRKAYSDAEIIELFATAATFELFPRFVDGLRIPVTPRPAISEGSKA